MRAVAPLAAASSSSSSSASIPSRRKASIAVSLEELVDRERAHLRRRREEAPVLRAEAARLRRHAAEVEGVRHLQRERMDNLHEADELDRQARDRETGVPELEFEKMAARYLHQHDALRGGGGGGDDAPARRPPSTAGGGEAAPSKIITVPGVRRETASCYRDRACARETRRHAIVQEFLCEATRATPKLVVRARDECPFCSRTLLLSGAKSCLVCTQCGYTLAHLDSTMQSVSYNEDYDFATFSYKRQSHFDDLLRLAQGKEAYTLPADIVEAVMRELHAQRVPKEEVTQAKVHQVLRKLRLRRAYDHVAQLTTTITGRHTPRISVPLENQCRQFFMRMQPAFERFCPKNRKNFLSYNYVLFRIFHLLGLHHMLGSVFLLKGREKLLLQDEIFAKIAESLGWEFVPIDQVLKEVRPT